MDEKFLAEQFEADRAHLTRVAYRMLGSRPEAEDAVQESWLRLSRDGANEVRAERAVVEAFLIAAREGNFEGLLAALDPQVVMRGDAAAIRLGGPRQVSGSATVAKFFQGRAEAARFILADGTPAILVAPNG